MEKLRIGIAGPGRIAYGVHFPNYQKNPDAKLAAVYSRSHGRAQKAAENFGFSGAFTDYGEMLESGMVDAVSICVPNALHAEMAIQALEAGCHVLCEKPPAIAAEDMARMEAAAKKAGKILSFNLQFRHSTEVQAIRSFIEGGDLGEIYSARVQALRRRGVPNWGVFTDKAMQGGGPLADIGVHMLDTALYLMGYPEPETAFAVMHQKIGNQANEAKQGGWDPQKFTIEDSASGIIRFRGGRSLVIETSFALNMEKQDVMNVELFGDKGGASVFPPRIFGTKHGYLTDTDLPHLKGQDMHERSISDFISSCLGHSEPLIKTGEAVALQRILEALYSSAESGEAVKF